MNRWDAVVAALTAGGVDTVFGLPDDDQGVLVAAGAAGLRFVVCRDQRNAVFAATGYALVSGRLGVVAVGKGPAVANAVTGLVEAARTPLVLLAGGTATRAVGSGAFQELDQVSLVRPLTAHAERVTHPDRLVPAVRRALLIAAARRRPVYVEVPDDLTGGTGGTAALPLHVPVGREHTTTGEETVRSAQRPLVLVGAGMRHRNADRLVERFAERSGAAVACTASGRGVVDEDHPQFVGLAGLYAPAAAGPLWAGADRVLALGSRLEETATHGWPAELAVVQVNTDPTDFATDRPGECVLGEAAAVVRAWTDLDHPAREPWRRQVALAREDLRPVAAPERVPPPSSDRHDIRRLLRVLAEELPASRVLVQENGLNDMWSYCFPAWSCGAAGGSVVPSEQTTLGFGAAAAIGARVAAPDRPVVAWVGDGAFGMLGNDIVTAVEATPGLLYVVLDNGGYGWLQDNADRHPGLTAAYTAAHRVGALPGLGAGVARVHLGPGDDPRTRVRAAWARCLAGETTVLVVPVDRADAPLGPVDGAFPAGAPS